MALILPQRRLAVRAVEGDPVARGSADRLDPDRRAAAPARLARPAVHPAGARRGACRRWSLCTARSRLAAHQGADRSATLSAVGGRRRPASTGGAAQEQASRPCTRCRCRPDCAGRAGPRRSARSGLVAQRRRSTAAGVPVRAQQVGTEMADQRRARRRWGPGRACRAGGRRPSSRRWPGRPGPAVARPPPGLAGPVHVPGARPSAGGCAASGAARRAAVSRCLPRGNHLEHLRPVRSTVASGRPRAGRCVVSAPAGQRRVQPVRGAPDRVALGHRSAPDA